MVNGYLLRKRTRKGGLKVVKIGRLFLLPFCVFVLFAMVVYPVYAITCTGGRVFSSKLRSAGKCQTANHFGITEDVYVTGRRFPRRTDVDIYVVPNKKWNAGDLIGTDVSNDGANTVQTDSAGGIPCTRIWVAPIGLRGKSRFDIVVDADQDGTFDPCDGDGVDDNRGIGFDVR